MTALTYSRDVSGQMFTGPNVEPFDIAFGVCEMRKVSNFNTGSAHARKRADVLAWKSHGCAHTTIPQKPTSEITSAKIACFKKRGGGDSPQASSITLYVYCI